MNVYITNVTTSASKSLFKRKDEFPKRITVPELFIGNHTQLIAMQV